LTSMLTCLYVEGHEIGLSGPGNLWTAMLTCL
jgi:hypothetical protein